MVVVGVEGVAFGIREAAPLIGTDRIHRVDQSNIQIRCCGKPLKCAAEDREFVEIHGWARQLKIVGTLVAGEIGIRRSTNEYDWPSEALKSPGNVREHRIV